MMINCREAARLASQALECPLSWWQSLKLKFHGKMCGWCHGHGKDLSSLRKAMQADHSDQATTQELSPEARERIMAVVREHLQADPSDDGPSA